MKKIIITKSQLKNIQESIDVAVQSPNNDISSYANTLTNTNTMGDLQKAKQTGADVNAVVSGPDSDDSSPVIDVDVPAGSTVQSVLTNNPDISKAVNNDSKIKVHGDGYPNESKIFSKNQIEEQRINNIKNNSVVITRGLFEEVERTKKNYTSWTPEMIEEIYSRIEEYDKNSDEYKAVRHAVFEMQRNGIKYPFLSNEKFPSILMYEGNFFANGKLIDD